VALVFHNQEVFSKLTENFVIHGVATEDGRSGVLGDSDLRKIYTYIPDSVERTCSQK